MWYIEFLRVRKALSIYGLMLLVLFAVTVAFRVYGTFHRYGADHFTSQPIEGLAAVGAFITAFFATALATSLAYHVGGHLEIAWTKPVSRDRFVFEVLLVDAIAISLAYLATIVSIITTIMVFSGRFPVVFSQLGIARTALEFVFVFAFYMVIQAVTSGQRRYAGMIAGIAWPVFLFIMAAPTMHMPPAVSKFFEVIDFMNPLALISVSNDPGMNDSGMIKNMLQLPLWSAPAVLDACALIVVAFIIALVRWRRIEA